MFILTKRANRYGLTDGLTNPKYRKDSPIRNIYPFPKVIDSYTIQDFSYMVLNR